MKPLFFALAATVMFGANNFAAETRFQSGPQHTSLVELYTSEGCSSCPPAEVWLSRLKDNPGLWKNFVPIAFHVDYWDRLGWKDRFSSKEWTQRQSRYASLWQSSSVYTPAVVLNGKELRNWSGASVSRPNEKPAGRLSAKTTDGKTFTIEFQPESGAAGEWEAHAALLVSGITSKIGAGENSGRNLPHDFVVLDLGDAAMKSDGGAWRASLTMNAADEKGARKAIAVWVSPRTQLAPVQATGGWLL